MSLILRAHRTAHLFRFLPAAALLAVLGPAAAMAQDAPAANAPAESGSAMSAEPPAEGTVSSYTAEQADRGKKAYTDECSGCHGTTLGGGGEIPALAGKGFREHWMVGSMQPIMDYIVNNMPQQAPGSLDLQTYADIGAYLMSRNRVPAGDTEVPADRDAWATITFPPLEEQ